MFSKCKKKTNFSFVLPVFFPLCLYKKLFIFSPDLASVTSFNVEENDFIVIATDGLWDNLPDATILAEIKKITVSSFKH